MGKWFIAFLMMLMLVGCGYLEMRSHEGPLFLVSKKGKLGWIDKKGGIIIKPQFYYAGDFHEGMAVVRIAGQFGYADMSNTDAFIDLKFEDARPFLNGKACVKLGGKWGVINKKLETIEPFELKKPAFKVPNAIKNREQFGLVKVSDKGRHCFKNNADEIVIPCRYEWLEPFVDGLAKFGDGEFEGYVTSKGKEIWRYEK